MLIGYHAFRFITPPNHVHKINLKNHDPKFIPLPQRLELPNRTRYSQLPLISHFLFLLRALLIRNPRPNTPQLHPNNPKLLPLLTKRLIPKREAMTTNPLLKSII